MKKHAANILSNTTFLIDRFGPRKPGSKASRDCADELAQMAEPYADSVKREDFSLSPGAFLGWIRILVAAYSLALAAMWAGWYFPAALILAAAVTLLVLQFFLYKEVIDPIYPKATGRNVLASLEPEGKVLGEFMISGHHDSAHIFNFLVHQPKLYALRVNGSIGSLIALALTNIVFAVLTLFGISLSWAYIPAVIFTILLSIVLQLWFFASPKHTPGAGDNLASSAAAWEFLKICSQQKKEGNGFKHLRLTVASWDAEEAGLRGSRAWRKKTNPAPLKHPLWNLNLECLYHENDLFFLTSDINGTVSLSSSLAEKCSNIMTKQLKRNIPSKPIAFLTGGTDAGEIARTGAQATTLMGMPWNNETRSSVYHTPLDKPESVSPEALEAALNLAEKLGKELDEELLNQSR